MATSVGGMGLPLFFSSNATATRMAVSGECLRKSVSVFETAAACFSVHDAVMEMNTPSGGRW
jgi:hypothetical protein